MKPRFYSKEAIGVSSLFLTPLFGCILFAYNLKEIGLQRLNPFFIIGGILWSLVFRKLVGEILRDNLFQLFVSNAVGAAILGLFLWDRFFDSYPSYDTKKVWKPLIVFTSICLALLLFQIFATRK